MKQTIARESWAFNRAREVEAQAADLEVELGMLRKRKENLGCVCMNFSGPFAWHVSYQYVRGLVNTSHL